jgi:hypothetical protein
MITSMKRSASVFALSRKQEHQVSTIKLWRKYEVDADYFQQSWIGAWSGKLTEGLKETRQGKSYSETQFKLDPETELMIDM